MAIWVYILIKIHSRVQLIWVYFIICKLCLDKDAKSPYIPHISIHLNSYCRREWLMVNSVNQSLSVSCLIFISHSVMSNSLWPHWLYPARLLCPWNSLGKNTGVGCHALLQGIFPTQGSNPDLLHLQADSLPSEPPGKPNIRVKRPQRAEFWEHSLAGQGDHTVLVGLGWSCFPLLSLP